MTRTILVVEDDRSTLANLKEAFDLWEFAATFAATPTSALIAADAMAQLDVLFCDYLLSGSMDGIELAQRLRQRFPDLLVVLTSGCPRDVVPVPPGVCFLAKPYSLAELGAALAGADL